jgi:hypothetical protein
MAVAARIDVPFEGDGEGVEELTWSQFASWHTRQAVMAISWTGGTMPLEAGTTVQDIATLLGFIMSRHQSLRTRLLPDGDGPPKQQLSRAGRVTLEVYPLDGDPAALAARIRAQYEAAGWDPATDWPVRMAAIADGDRAVYLVALYVHMAIDGHGFEALIADLANLDRATGRHLAPVGGIQPLELARAQRGPAARRQHESSLRYWDRHLRTIEPRRFPAREPEPERWWEATFTTPATGLALAVVAERTKVHTGTVLLAAYAVMVARLSGQPVGAFRLVVSNRFRPRFAESVSNLALAGLAVIDTDAGTFDEVVARAWSSQLAAGVHAYYHPRDLWPLVERIGAERGTELDTLCYFNDRRRLAAQPPGGPLPAPGQIRAAAGRSHLRWGHRSNDFDATCYLHVDATPGGIELTWRVDTAAVSPAMLEACVRGIESLVVAAALAEDAALERQAV